MCWLQLEAFLDLRSLNPYRNVASYIRHCLWSLTMCDESLHFALKMPSDCWLSRWYDFTLVSTKLTASIRQATDVSTHFMQGWNARILQLLSVWQNKRTEAVRSGYTSWDTSLDMATKKLHDHSCRDQSSTDSNAILFFQKGLYNPISYHKNVITLQSGRLCNLISLFQYWCIEHQLESG